MNTKDLVKVIDALVEKRLNAKVKQLIREEVSSQVNKVMSTMLVEMMKESKKPTIVESSPQASSPIQTKNPKLNSALAETIRDFKPLQKTGNLVDLLDGGFDKIGDIGEAYEEPVSADQPKVNIEPDGTNIGFLKSVVTEGTTTGQQQSVLGTDAVPDILKGVFKKDFRAVMRKMDEQKKNGTMGMIDPRSVLG